MLTAPNRSGQVTAVLVSIGHTARSELVGRQLEAHEQGYIKVIQRTSGTVPPGVFACGDVVDHTYRQGIKAAGTGCSAALDAQRYLSALGDASVSASTFGKMVCRVSNRQPAHASLV